MNPSGTFRGVLFCFSVARSASVVVTCQMTVISLFFGTIGDVVGPRGGKMKNRKCFSYGNFGDKNHRTCLLSDEGHNSFPKHLDLALAPDKTNEGVKKR